MRLELVRLAQGIAGAHRKIFARQAALRTVLGNLSERPFAERMPQQQEFMRYSEVEQAALDRLREELKVLQEQRLEKAKVFTKFRSAREAMEKLREKALLKHTREMLKQDQKQLDDNSRLAFGREIIERRVGVLE